MSTRRWTVAVAAVAALLASARAWERTRRCLVMARFHTEEAAFETEMAESPPAIIGCGTYWVSLTPEERRRELASRPSPSEERALYLRRAAYHLHARSVLRRSAWRPWETLPDIPPDPPEE